MRIEDARKIIKDENLYAGYLYEPFEHVINYDGIILEKTDEGYRVCRRSVCERDCEYDYDVDVFTNEAEALNDFIAKLRKLNELRKIAVENKTKLQRKSDFDKLTLRLSILFLVIVGILGLICFLIP